MYFEQFYLGCLAHASYILASDGETVVVDPQRDVELYLKAAADQAVTIRHIFETHLHADFVWLGPQECGLLQHVTAARRWSQVAQQPL